MAKSNYVPDSKGVGEFLRSSEMQKMVRRSGDAIAARSGSKFVADTWISPTAGRSGEPRAVSGVFLKPNKFPRGSKAQDKVRGAIDAGRV